MRGELERRAKQLAKETEKQLAEIRHQETVGRASTDMRETLASYETSLRLLNGYALTSQAQQHLTSLNAYTARVSRDNPGLEMQHRELETIYTLAAGQLIYGYMGRPRHNP